MGSQDRRVKAPSPAFTPQLTLLPGLPGFHSRSQSGPGLHRCSHMAAMRGMKAFATEFSIEQRLDSGQQVGSPLTTGSSGAATAHAGDTHIPTCHPGGLFSGVEYIWTCPRRSCLFCKWPRNDFCATLGTAQPPSASQCLTCCVTITGFSPPSTEIPTIAQCSERNRALHVVYINECSDKPQTPRRCHLPGEQALERTGWASAP